MRLVRRLAYLWHDWRHAEEPLTTWRCQSIKALQQERVS